jgi:TPR repeat protein
MKLRLSLAVVVVGLLSQAAAQELVDLHKQALAGDASAQLSLGERYRLGLGVKTNAAEALRIYSLAAEQGVPEAQFALAEMYRFGEAGAPDYQQAVR